MNTPRILRPPASLALLALLPLLGATDALAQLTVDATVTPKAGSFLYEISITNNDPTEYVIGSFSDAPLADPLIDPSLITPAGFLGSYDDGLGFVDFLADTDSFLPGSTVSGFSFESLADPWSAFTQFEGLDLDGNVVSGLVNLTVVPESGTLGAVALLGFTVAATQARRRRHSSTVQLSS